VAIATDGCSSATRGGGIWGICPPSRNYQHTAKQFLHVQKLSKNKDEILYAIHENLIF